MRLGILSKYGGVYLDADFLVLKFFFFPLPPPALHRTYAPQNHKNTKQVTVYFDIGSKTGKQAS